MSNSLLILCETDSGGLSDVLLTLFHVRVCAFWMVSVQSRGHPLTASPGVTSTVGLSSPHPRSECGGMGWMVGWCLAGVICRTACGRGAGESSGGEGRTRVGGGMVSSTGRSHDPTLTPAGRLNPFHSIPPSWSSMFHAAIIRESGNILTMEGALQMPVLFISRRDFHPPRRLVHSPILPPSITDTHQYPSSPHHRPSDQQNH